MYKYIYIYRVSPFVLLSILFLQGKMDAALDHFKKDTGVRALLLPLARGANGINLTAAQHVMFVEPLLNPAVEAQVVNVLFFRLTPSPETFFHFEAFRVNPC